MQDVRRVVRLAWKCDALVIVSEAGPRPSLLLAEIKMAN